MWIWKTKWVGGNRYFPTNVFVRVIPAQTQPTTLPYPYLYLCLCQQNVLVKIGCVQSDSNPGSGIL